MDVGRIVLAASVLALVACAGPVDTRIRIVVDADPSVRARARDLHLVVISARDQETSRYEETRPTSETGWPAEVSLVPRVGAGAARVRVEIAALDTVDAIVSRGELSTDFELGVTREVHLFLTSGCAARPCSPDGGPTSDGGTTGPTRDAGTGVPPRDAAAHMDAGLRGTRDGGARDAGTPCASTAETCEGVRDDDCDARVDEGCECTDGASRACDGEERGLCTGGTQSCSGGRWGACRGRVDPVGESCNDSDDDCDGATDEHLRRACGREGRCVQTCRGGDWGRCEDDGDRCSGHDDDD